MLTTFSIHQTISENYHCVSVFYNKLKMISSISGFSFSLYWSNTNMFRVLLLLQNDIQQQPTLSWRVIECLFVEVLRSTLTFSGLFEQIKQSISLAGAKTTQILESHLKQTFRSYDHVVKQVIAEKRFIFLCLIIMVV